MEFDKLEDKLKEIWNNPKYQSLVKLAIYLIIIIVAVMIGRKGLGENENIKDITNNSSKTLSNSEILENFKNAESYKATYIIDGKEYTYTIVNKELLKIEDTTYEIVDNKLVNLLDDTSSIPKFDLDFWLLKPKYLVSLSLFSSDDTSYIKKYTSGETRIGYEIPLLNFISTFEGNKVSNTKLDNIEDKVVNLEFKLLDNHVISTELDLNEYLSMYDNKIVKSLIKISYFYE